MEYTVQALAKVAGISGRTLRYYDEIGLLSPARLRSSGYRVYGPAEVDRLQQILFYRELGVDLETIRRMLNSPSFDRVQALRTHRHELLERRRRLDLLIENVENTIASAEGRLIMSDAEKFEGFKKQAIEGNEVRYGNEVRERYGDDVVNQSNEQFLKMTPEDYERFTQLEKEVKEALEEAFQTGNPASEPAQRAADLHRQWLSFTWPNYSKEAHAGLAKMYVDDERFRAYYDEKQPGMAKFLRDAILIYTGV